jgi:hypothetical protein
MSYEAAIATLVGRRSYPRQIPYHLPRRQRSKLVLRLPPGCFYSWQQLKEKFSLNFQGFQAELDTEEDFLSCAQKQKDTLPNFYQRFLQQKAQAPEVSNDQVIAQAIKALRAWPLHNHLVKERPKTVSELYEQFTKFSKLEIQHFRKLEQQRKISKPGEAPSPRNNENQHNHRTIGRRIMGHPHIQHRRGLVTRDSIKSASITVQ